MPDNNEFYENYELLQQNRKNFKFLGAEVKQKIKSYELKESELTRLNIEELENERQWIAENISSLDTIEGSISSLNFVGDNKEYQELANKETQELNSNIEALKKDLETFGQQVEQAMSLVNKRAVDPQKNSGVPPNVKPDDNNISVNLSDTFSETIGSIIALHKLFLNDNEKQNIDVETISKYQSELKAFHQEAQDKLLLSNPTQQLSDQQQKLKNELDKIYSSVYEVIESKARKINAQQGESNQPSYEQNGSVESFSFETVQQPFSSSEEDEYEEIDDNNMSTRNQPTSVRRPPPPPRDETDYSNPETVDMLRYLMAELKADYDSTKGNISREELKNLLLRGQKIFNKIEAFKKSSREIEVENKASLDQHINVFHELTKEMSTVYKSYDQLEAKQAHEIDDMKLMIRAVDDDLGFETKRVAGRDVDQFISDNAASQARTQNTSMSAKDLMASKFKGEMLKQDDAIVSKKNYGDGAQGVLKQTADGKVTDMSRNLSSDQKSEVAVQQVSMFLANYNPNQEPKPGKIVVKGKDLEMAQKVYSALLLFTKNNPSLGKIDDLVEVRTPGFKKPGMLTSDNAYIKENLGSDTKTMYEQIARAQQVSKVDHYKQDKTSVAVNKVSRHLQKLGKLERKNEKNLGKEELYKQDFGYKKPEKFPLNDPDPAMNHKMYAALLLLVKHDKTIGTIDDLVDIQAPNFEKPGFFSSDDSYIKKHLGSDTFPIYKKLDAAYSNPSNDLFKQTLQEIKDDAKAKLGGDKQVEMNDKLDKDTFKTGFGPKP